LIVVFDHSTLLSAVIITCRFWGGGGTE